MINHLFKTKNLALLILCMGAIDAQSATLYSNLGTGSSYDTSNALTVGDGYLNQSTNFIQASSFVEGITANLGSISIALSDLYGAASNDPLSVELVTDNSGNPGSTVLESFSIAAATLGNFGANNALVQLTSILNPLLVAGTQYWVEVISSGLANGDVVTWNYNNTGVLNDSLSTDGGASWQSGNTSGAFALTSASSTPIPEPGSIALFVAGILGFGVSRKQRPIK